MDRITSRRMVGRGLSGQAALRLRSPLVFWFVVMIFLRECSFNRSVCWLLCVSSPVS